MYSIVFQHLQLAELSDSQEHLLSVFPKCIRCLLTGLMSWMWPFSTRKPGTPSKASTSNPRPVEKQDSKEIEIRPSKCPNCNVSWVESSRYIAIALLGQGLGFHLQLFQFNESIPNACHDGRTGRSRTSENSGPQTDCDTSRQGQFRALLGQYGTIRCA